MFKNNLKPKVLAKAFFCLFAVLLCAQTVAAAEKYPKLDLAGYKKYEYKQVTVDPISNYFLGISHIGYSPTYSGGAWQERLLLTISGDLSPHLSVSYDLDQQPETPDKYNVKVKYDQHELSFGDINTSFSGNEFAAVSKYVNGVMYTFKNDWHEFILVPSSKGHSQTQGLTSQYGNNTRGPYSLGHGSIVEGTEHIELNGRTLRRDIDYTIDYFEGTATFVEILTTDDEFKYSYEYTNILDLFFPSLSKRDFFGFQDRVTLDPRTIGRPTPQPMALTGQTQEAFPTVFAEEQLTKEVIVIPVKVKEKFAPLLPTGEDPRAYYEIRDGDTLSDIIDNSHNANFKKLWRKLKGQPDRFDLFYRIVALALGLQKQQRVCVGQKLRIEQVSLAELERAQEYELNADETTEFRPPEPPGGEESRVVTIEASLGEVSEEGVAVYVEGLGVVSGPEGTAESLAQTTIKNEALGKYKLGHFPLVEFSENVQFRGSLLVKDIDYTINYLNGEINLLLPDLPTTEDHLVVTYVYKIVSHEAELICGVGSRGPYSLKKGQVIFDSEKVFIDDVPAMRDLDYVIDYAQGKLVFNFAISEASRIAVDYDYQQIWVPPPLPEPEKNKLTFGTTYLREKSEKGSGAPTATVIFSTTGSQVISDDNTLYLDYFPIVPTDEATFTLTINGTEAAFGVDYAIPLATLDPATGYASVEPQAKLAYINDRNDLSDGYTTGTVKFLRTIESSDEITVVYSYKKSVVGTFSGVGSGSRGPYYLKGYRNVVPGTETVQVWQQGSSTMTTYIRNSSFEADAGTTGYSINYYDDNPYVTFNEVLNTDYNFSVIFEYVAESSNVGEDLIKDVIGVDSSLTLGEVVKVSAAVARSSTDQVIATSITNEAFAGDGTRTYTLHAPGDIVENSEVVYVNNYVRNRDEDYYINYTSPGQIVFYYITPTTLDAVVVSYKFQDSSATGGEVSEKTGLAYKFAGSTQLGGLYLAGDFRHVDQDFTAMGGTALGEGSEQKNYTIKYAPNTAFNFETSLRETADPLSNYTNKFKRGYDRNTSLAFSLINFGDASLSYRNYLIEDDRLSDTSLRSYDSLVESLLAAYRLPTITWGNLIFDSKEEYKATSTRTDYLDRVAPTTTATTYFRTNNTFKFTDRFTFGLDHQISEPLTTASTYEGGITSEVASVHTVSRDTTYDLTFNFTLAPIKKWTAYFKLINHEQVDVLDLSSPTNTRNETYRMDFVPIDWLVSAVDRSRAETLSVLVNGENPKTDRTATSLKWLPHSSTTVDWAGAWDDAYYETGSHTRGNSNTYTLNYTPIVLSYFRFDTKFTKYLRNAMAPSGTFEVNTDTDTFTQDYSMTYLPFVNFKVIPSFKQEDYLNYNDSTASPVYTNTQNQTTGVKLSYTPITPLDFTSSYDLKVTKNLLDDICRHKSILSLGTLYRIFTWGTLTYDWSKEDNQGEVQAGSLTDLDLIKTTNQVAMQITVPQSNVILSSIVFKVSYKHVNYINNLSTSDNFNASLLSFEGTLNF